MLGKGWMEGESFIKYGYTTKLLSISRGAISRADAPRSLIVHSLCIEELQLLRHTNKRGTHIHRGIKLTFDPCRTCMGNSIPDSQNTNIYLTDFFLITQLLAHMKRICQIFCSKTFFSKNCRIFKLFRFLIFSIKKNGRFA